VCWNGYGVCSNLASSGEPPLLHRTTLTTAFGASDSALMLTLCALQMLVLLLLLSHGLLVEVNFLQWADFVNVVLCEELTSSIATRRDERCNGLTGKSIIIRLLLVDYCPPVCGAFKSYYAWFERWRIACFYMWLVCFWLIMKFGSPYWGHTWLYAILWHLLS